MNLYSERFSKNISINEQDKNPTICPAALRIPIEKLSPIGYVISLTKSRVIEYKGIRQNPYSPKQMNNIVMFSLVKYVSRYIIIKKNIITIIEFKIINTFL